MECVIWRRTDPFVKSTFFYLEIKKFDLYFLRVFWLLISLVSLASCIYMIIILYNKYNENPVILSFATVETPLFQVPFPSVSICPETKSKKQIFDFYESREKIMRNEPLSEIEYNAHFLHLNLIIYVGIF